MSRLTLRLATTACAVAALTAGIALAGEAKPAKETGALNDMKVARDKDTGQLRAATAEEIAELKASTKSLAPNVVVVRRPATTIEVRPNGSAVGKRSLDDLDNLVLTRTPDGKNVLRHSDHPAPAAPAK